jgi:hypothetical protein
MLLRTNDLQTLDHIPLNERMDLLAVLRDAAKGG